jgi:hypothetical protein
MTSYKLEVWHSIPGRSMHFSLHHIQIGPEAHSALCLTGIGRYFVFKQNGRSVKLITLPASDEIHTSCSS